MGRGLMAGLLLLLTFIGNAQLRWDGGAGSDRWMDEQNWEGDRLPGVSDTVLLDHSSVTGTYRVRFPDGDTAVQVQQLILAPGFGDSIFLWLPAGNTASQALWVDHVGDAIIIGNRGVFINQSGASSGTPVAVSNTGWLRIENGGRYIHRTERGHTTGLVSRLSQEPGTERGVFEFDVPGTAAYTVSVSNRVYGALCFSAETSGGNKTYTGAGINPFLIRSNLEIRNRAAFNYGSNVGLMRIEGNCRIDSGGRWNLANGTRSSNIQLVGDLYLFGGIQHTGSADSTLLEWCGTAQQQVVNKGTLQGSFRCRINNSQGVVFNSNFYFPVELELVSGSVRVADTAALYFSSEASVKGASSDRFIDGAIVKAGAAPFLFPTGEGNIYAPLAMSASDQEEDTIRVRYFRASPLSWFSVASEPPVEIDHLSDVELWEMEAGGSGGERLISLYAHPLSFVRDTSSLMVIGIEEGSWKNKGRSSFNLEEAGALWLQGWVQAATTSSKARGFTFGSTSDRAVNPLPVRISHFNVHWLSAPVLAFSWSQHDPVPAGTRVFLELYRQGEWVTMWDSCYRLPQSAGQYQSSSRLPVAAEYLMRLRVSLPDGDNNFSQIRSLPALLNTTTAKVIPNPGSGPQWLHWPSALGKLQSLRIFDAGGRVRVQQQQLHRLQADRIELHCGGLPAGWYLLEAMDEKGHSVRVPFLRQ